MPRMYNDRVMETLQSGFTGTGTFNLGGAVSNAQTFVGAFGTGNPCYYLARKIDWSKFEEGYGIVTDASPDTLTRVEVFRSFDGASYGTSKIDWAASDTVIIYSAPLGANGGQDGPHLIDEQVLSSAASYIKDSISARFNFLRISFSVRPATDAQAVSLVLRKASGTDITSYDRSVLFTTASSANGSNALAQSTCVLSTTTENTSPQGVVGGEITVQNIQSSDHKVGAFQVSSFTDGGVLAPIFGAYKCNDTNPITGVKLLFGSGNIAAGRVRVEGF